MTAVKFPRRYHQRINISKRQRPSSAKDSAGNNKPQAQEVRVRKETKAARTSRKHIPDAERDSDSASDYGSDPEDDGNDDSGYSSSSTYEEVSETYEEMRARYIAEGPVMPELSDGSKAMVKAEELRWKA
jgi:hypothetical protein